MAETLGMVCPLRGHTTRPIYDCCSILQLMMIWPMSQATKRRPSIISCPYCGS